jgi:cytochrome P450
MGTVFTWSPEIMNDPTEWYTKMREHSPVFVEVPEESRGNYLGGDFWGLFRSGQVQQVLRDHETFSSASIAAGGQGLVMLSDDPPRHTRLRGLVNKAFTPRRVDALRPWIAETAAGLAAALPADGADLMAGFADLLPMNVIARLLGVSADEQDRFKRCVQAFFEFDPADADALSSAVGYFAAIVAQRRAAPAGDDQLSDQEVLGFCILLLAGGMETTADLIGNLTNILAHRPQLWQQLRDNRDLVGPAVEETLRYDAPAQLTTRLVTRDVQIGNARIPQGSRVAAFFAAANRDPDEFPDPDEFRLDREPNNRNHLAFGHGVHFCLGAPLARVEAVAAINALLDRFGTVTPAGSAERKTVSPFVRGFARLPLAFTPA